MVPPAFFARRPAVTGERAGTYPRPPALTLWFTSLALLLFAVQGVNIPNSTPVHNRAVVLAWLLGVILFGFSVLQATHGSPPRLAGRAKGWHTRRREVMALTLVALLAFVSRTYQLTSHPYAFINDEGSMGLEALRILRGARTDLFGVGWSANSMWSFVPHAFSIWLLGHTVLAVRTVSAVEGALAVVMVYALAREALGRTVAVLAAGFLVAFPLHLHFSRLGVGNVVDSLLGPLVLWLTFRAIRRGTVSSHLWAGLGLGLTLYAYLGSRLVVVVALGALAFQAVRQRGYLRGHVPHLLVFAAAAIFVAAPMAAFFVRHPDYFMARVNSESILQNGWLRQQVAVGRAVPEALLEQFAKSTLVYIAWGAPAGFFNSPQPYLTPLAAAFFVLGMVYTLLRLGQPFYLTLFIWFWAVVILGSSLTVNAPTSERLVQSIPALAIFVALGLRRTADVLQRLDLLPARWGMAVSAVVIAITNVQGASFYFLTYRNGHYFEDAANELALEANLYASKLGPAYRFYLLGEPRVSVAFPNFSYLTPDVEKRNLTVVTRETLAALPRDRGAFFVAIPERQAELKQVARWAPGGQWWEMPRRNQPGVLYYAYLLSPEQFARPAADRLT